MSSTTDAVIDKMNSHVENLIELVDAVQEFTVDYETHIFSQTYDSAQSFVVIEQNGESYQITRAFRLGANIGVSIDRDRATLSDVIEYMQDRAVHHELDR